MGGVGIICCHGNLKERKKKFGERKLKWRKYGL